MAQLRRKVSIKNIVSEPLLAAACRGDVIKPHTEAKIGQEIDFFVDLHVQQRSLFPRVVSSKLELLASKRAL